MSQPSRTGFTPTGTISSPTDRRRVVFATSEQWERVRGQLEQQPEKEAPRP